MNGYHRDRHCRAAGQKRFFVLVALMGLSVVLAACGEEPSENATMHPAAHSQEAPDPVYQAKRIEMTEHTAPEQWLASREAGRNLTMQDPSVERMKQTLAVASRRFREHPRMIANRAVQLEDMLTTQNMGEPASKLIERLSNIPGDERYVESFGALCQHYYNLRMQGRDPEAAMAKLKEVADASR
jgi:hypothetical protein